MERQEIRETLTNGQEPLPTQRFEAWCLVELFGHQRIAGLVTEATIGGCAFVRVDVPNPSGEGVKYTRYFGNGAIYAINPTTREEVLRLVLMMHPAPPTPRIHEQRALPAHEDDLDFGDDPDDEDDG